MKDFIRLSAIAVIVAAIIIVVTSLLSGCSVDTPTGTGTQKNISDTQEVTDTLTINIAESRRL